MATVGRNDRCPCGSGKKYKVCCLGKGKKGLPVERMEQETTPLAMMRTKMFEDLAEFTNRHHRQVMKAGRELFPRPDDFEDDDGHAFPVETETETDWMTWMLNGVFFDLPAKPEGEVIAESYLLRMYSKLSEDEKVWLMEMVNAPLIPYEILEVQLEVGFKARNLWTGEEVVVSERAGARMLTVWDILVARITRERGHFVLESGLYLFHAAEKARIEDRMVEYRRAAGLPGGIELTPYALRLFSTGIHDLWLDMVLDLHDAAEGHTSEGDLVELTDVAFDLHDEKAVKRALRKRKDVRALGDESFAWVEPNGEGGRRVLGRIFIEGPLLLLETRSIPRAVRGREMLLSLARGALSVIPKGPVDCTEDEDDAHGNRDLAEPGGGALSGHGVRPEDLPAFMDRHYQAWIDRPHPDLEDETPRNAVRTSAGRFGVTSLLKVLENRQSERGLPPYDFGWMWKELRLPRS